MSFEFIDGTSRADNTWDILVELDGNRMNIIGAHVNPDDLESIEAFVRAMVVKNIEAADNLTGV